MRRNSMNAPSSPSHGPPRCWPESLSRHAESARSSQRPPLREKLSSPRSISPRVPSLPSKPTDPGKTEQTHLPPPTLSPSLHPIPHLLVVATVSSASNATTNKLPGAERLHSLQDGGGRHAVADAHDLQAELPVGGFEAGEHLRHEAGPGGPQRMAVGYGPAPGVYPLHVGG
jgi:hypothetical protein